MAKSWLAGLSDEDVSFVKRFVLASGSLKELAEAYGIQLETGQLVLVAVTATLAAIGAAGIISILSSPRNSVSPMKKNVASAVGWACSLSLMVILKSGS